MALRGMGIWRIKPSKEVKSSSTQYVGHPFLVVSARSPPGIGADPAHDAAVGPNRGLKA
jgi:hypothetical protein